MTNKKPRVQYGSTTRVTVSKAIIDELIRKKIANTPACGGCEAMPVVVASDGIGGSNWDIPGWVGDTRISDRCKQAIGDYLEFLGGQFNVAEEAE